MVTDNVKGLLVTGEKIEIADFLSPGYIEHKYGIEMLGQTERRIGESVFDIFYDAKKKELEQGNETVLCFEFGTLKEVFYGPVLIVPKEECHDIFSLKEICDHLMIVWTETGKTLICVKAIYKGGN